MNSDILVSNTNLIENLSLSSFSFFFSPLSSESPTKKRRLSSFIFDAFTHFRIS